MDSVDKILIYNHSGRKVLRIFFSGMFIMACKVVLTFESADEILACDIHVKTLLCSIFLWFFESVDETHKYNHSNKG